MDIRCTIGQHDWKKVYPDQDLIDGIIFKQSIEEIYECTQCGKTKRVMGTVGEIVSH